MNKVLNKSLLTGVNFMSKWHLRQSGVTCISCGPFNKHFEKIQNIKETK